MLRTQLTKTAVVSKNISDKDWYRKRYLMEVLNSEGQWLPKTNRETMQ